MYSDYMKILFVNCFREHLKEVPGTPLFLRTVNKQLINANQDVINYALMFQVHWIYYF